MVLGYILLGFVILSILSSLWAAYRDKEHRIYRLKVSVNSWFFVGWIAWACSLFILGSVGFEAFKVHYSNLGLETSSSYSWIVHIIGLSLFVSVFYFVYKVSKVAFRGLLKLNEVERAYSEEEFLEYVAKLRSWGLGPIADLAVKIRNC